jgi:hypothetical protein
MTPEWLYLSVFTGAFGSGYFIYGKKQRKAVPLVSGILLCCYNYFVDDIIIGIIIGLSLLAAPFIIQTLNR